VNLETVCTRILELLGDLERGSRGGSPRDLFRAALAVEHAVMSGLLAPEEEEAVLADPRIAGRMATSQKIFCDLESAIERSMADVVRLEGARSVLRQEDVSQHYLARYEYLARNEVELAAMGKGDRALFIGSGFLPITAFEYAWQSGCTVDCVDFVPAAVECSRQIVERLDLTGRVRVLQARGEAHDPSPYDVILVGVLAAPKDAILRNLDAGAKAGCRILLRTTYGLRQLIYQRATYDRAAFRRLTSAGRSIARGDRVISAELVTVR
jgi:hypothetical protein